MKIYLTLYVHLSVSCARNAASRRSSPQRVSASGQAAADEFTIGTQRIDRYRASLWCLGATGLDRGPEVADEKGHTVTCAVLGISISWFHKWIGRGPTERARRRAALDAKVRELFEGHCHVGERG
jgi:hypothetical protein